ncbi:MAG: radical SAM protein [Nitrospinae bacterium]|nr:radical SAM protein [Nitrospinota bacterium]
MKNQYIETHIESEIRTFKDAGIEDLYISQKGIFLTERLARIQEAVDKKGVGEGQGFLLMVLYIFQFIENESSLVDKILDCLSFTGWPLKRFLPLLDKNSLDEKIKSAIYIYNEIYKNSKLAESDASFILTIYNELNLQKDRKNELEGIVEKAKRNYSQIGIGYDLERSRLIKSLADKNSRRVKLNLQNIAIIPTELCPNNCRFCLSPWKADVSERGRKADKDYQELMDKIIRFAEDKKITLTITGGEPFLEMERVLYLLKRCKTRIEATTSGIWADEKEKTENILKRINEAVKGKNFILQISLDAFHQEMIFKEGILNENIPLNNIANIIEISQKKFPNIMLCLLLKYTRYHDPFVRLLKELEARGFKWSLKDKQFNPRLTVPAAGVDGNLIMKPALQKAFLKLENTHPQAKPIFIMYTQMERIGKAVLLEEFEFPVHKERLQRFLEGEDNSEKFPLSNIEVSDDGNVYPEAYSLYSWSLGNIWEASLDEIYKLAEYDPLIIALAEEPARIRDIAFRLKPELHDEVNGLSSPISAVYKMLEGHEMRLRITEELIK